MSTPPAEDLTAGDPDEPPRATTPQITTAPATNRRRLWPSSVPARIGPARTSTVVLGLLFVLAWVLYVPPPTTATTTTTTTGTSVGRVSRTTPPPSTVAPTTAEAPGSPTSEDTSAPPTDQTTTQPKDTESSTSSSRATTTRAPATTTTQAPAPFTTEGSPAPTS